MEMEMQVPMHNNVHHQVQRVANPHQISWFIVREKFTAPLHHSPKLVLFFPTAQTTNGIPRQTAFDHFLHARFAQVQIQPALYDSVQILLFRAGVSFDATVEPSDRSPHGLLYLRCVRKQQNRERQQKMRRKTGGVQVFVSILHLAEERNPEQEHRTLPQTARTLGPVTRDETTSSNCIIISDPIAFCSSIDFSGVNNLDHKQEMPLVGA